MFVGQGVRWTRGGRVGKKAFLGLLKPPRGCAGTLMCFIYAECRIVAALDRATKKLGIEDLKDPLHFHVQPIAGYIDITQFMSMVLQFVILK